MLDVQTALIQGEWVLRIFIAMLCGCVIGYERTSRHKEAGLRTHAILAMGAALIMIVSKYGFYDMNVEDGSRIAAQVVSGIGFLGAGVIFVKNGTVAGLTTAAGMWATTGIGLCIGAGLYFIGIISVVFILGMQTLFHKGFIIKKFQFMISMHLEVNYHDGVFKELCDTLYEYKSEIHDIKIQKKNDAIMILDIDIIAPNNLNKNQLLCEMINKDYVKKFKYI